MRTTRTTRRTALLALAAAAVTAPLLGPIAPASAAPGGFTVVDHNVEKFNSVLTKAVDTANARGADALTLQEVCGTDADALAASRPGWAMHFAPSRADGCSSKGKGDVGTLVVWRKGTDVIKRDFPLPADPGRVPQLSCLRFGSAPVKHVCSTHLVSEDQGTGIRAQQTAEIKRLTAGWIADDHLVVVGGDFNATPDKPEMNAMFARGGDGRFVSAHQLEGRAEKTTDSGRQIDYVFFSQNRASSGGLQVTPTGSDHHMLVATTRWG